MKTEELRDFTVDELKSNLHNMQEELFTLKFKRKAQSVQNPLKIRSIRRDIARVLTIIHEKETGRNSSK